MKKETLTKTRLLDLLDKLERDAADYITIYAKQASFPRYVLDAIAQGPPAPEMKEAVGSEDILREAERYGTGAAIFWSQTGSRRIILPAFPFAEDRISSGRPETSPLRQLLERERVLGIVLLNWGSYAIAALNADKLIEYKTGTGHIHQKHRKGGSSQKRFARRTEEQKKDFLRRVANHVDEKFRAHVLDEIFLGGNRLIAKPLVQESLYLKSKVNSISTRFLNVRYADREALLKSLEDAYESVFFEYGVNETWVPSGTYQLPGP